MGSQRSRAKDSNGTMLWIEGNIKGRNEGNRNFLSPAGEEEGEDPGLQV